MCPSFKHNNYQWRVQEFVREGAVNLKGFFLLFNFLRAQKIAEKMIFPTKKVAKYR